MWIIKKVDPINCKSFGSTYNVYRILSDNISRWVNEWVNKTQTPPSGETFQVVLLVVEVEAVSVYWEWFLTFFSDSINILWTFSSKLYDPTQGEGEGGGQKRCLRLEININMRYNRIEKTLKALSVWRNPTQDNLWLVQLSLTMIWIE